MPVREVAQDRQDASHEADVNHRGIVGRPGMEYVRVCRSLAQRLLRASTNLLSSKSMPTTRPLVPPPPTRSLHSARAAGVDRAAIGLDRQHALKDGNARPPFSSFDDVGVGAPYCHRIAAFCES